MKLAGSRQFSRTCLAVSIALYLTSYSAASQESINDAKADTATGAVSSSVQEEVLVVGDGSQVVLPEAFAGGQVARGGRAGILGNLDMMDAPFSSVNFTEELIRAQQSNSVADVLQNDPVVRVAKGFGNFQDLYVIRGFPVFSDDMTYNGVYGILPRQYVAAEFLERVEVFRGANSFINGASPGGSSIGGAVNLVPKRAAEESLTRLSTGVETGGQAYVAMDLGRRFGADDNTGIRINVVRRDGETSVEDQERELSVFSIGLDHSGEDFRLSADVGYQDHHIDAPRPSVTPYAELPNVPDADTNYAQPWTYTDERQAFGVARGEYDIGETTTVWLAAGMRRGEEDNRLANPNSDENGVTSAYRFDNSREDKVYSADAGVRTEFATGAVDHRLTLSASVFSSESRNAYAFSSFAGFAGDLYHPYPVAPPAADFFIGGDLDNPGVTEEIDTSSYAIADMMSFLDDRVLVTLGARYQTLKKKTFDYNTGTELSSYDESVVTPVAAVVYQPSEYISLYANYSEALVPGDTAPFNSGGAPVLNAGELLEPFQSEQYEVGVKADYERVGGSISLFSINKPVGRVENQIFTDGGEQLNRGVEVSVFGQPVDQVRLIGGFTWVQAEMKKTQDGLLDGNDAIGVPELQANMNVEWDVPGINGFTLDARGVYTSSQYADEANDISLSSWHRFDVGARYEWRLGSKPVMLRARVQNLTNEDDWVSVGGYPGSNYLILGGPRTVMLSASVEL